MQTAILFPRKETSVSGRMRPLFLIVALILLLPALRAIAQPLSGTYTVGGGGAYASIEAAITDLNARGVSAPVTFAIRTGTYTPPATGYVLSQVATMSLINTVTFKPDAGAIVTIDGSLSTPIFDLSGGDFYIIDGANTVGGTVRSMKVIQRGTGQVIRFLNGATFNTVRNTNLVSNSSTTTAGAIAFSTSTGVGNSGNKIVGNTIGDSTGVLRTSTGIYMLGSSAAHNSANIVDNNDIINLGYSNGYIYGVRVDSYNDSVKILRNRIRVTNTVGSSGVYPLYGVYISNTSNVYDTIAYNRIWDLKSLYTTAETNGIYVSTLGASPMSIHDNMIALNGTSAGALYGIQVSSSVTSSSTLYADFNSISLSGPAVSYSSYDIYMGSSVTMTARNNVLSNTRVANSGSSSYLLYRASSLGTFTSNYNLFYINGSGTVAGYLSGSTGGPAQATLALWKSNAGKDANSVAGDPRFVDAAADLHLSTALRTPAESDGTPIAGLLTDFDGDARNGSTPDIGADEGAFLPLFGNDLAAGGLVTPTPGSTVAAATLFAPVATVTNIGLNAQTNVNVRYRILDAGGNVVYSDVQAIASIAAGTSTQVTFNQTGNQPGSASTALAAGSYTIEIRTQLAGDADPSNDLLTGTITAKSRLSGTYTINRSGVGGRNYTTITAATADLNALGVSGPVVFEIASGTYDASTETFPITLGAAFGMSAANTVTFRPASGATVLLTGASPSGTSGLVMIDGGKYYIIDGANSVGGTTRNMTIRQTEAVYNPTLWLRNDADNNIIRNCVLMGSAASSTRSSSTTGIGIVYIGLTTAASGNDSNLVRNCTIGDPAGVYRNNVGAGVYSTSGKPNSGNRFVADDILNFGNFGTSIGFVAYAEQAGTVVDGCDIHMTVASPVATIYGIYTDYSPGYPINSVFNGNRIYRLTSTATNMTVYGIYHWVSTAAANSTISNNMISLAEDGDHTYYGIYFASSSGSTSLYHNSIYVGGTSTGSRAVTVLYKSSANTIVARNNLFVSTRTGGSASNYGINLSSPSGWQSDYNLFSLTGGGGNYFTGSYSGTQRATLADFRSSTGGDAASVAGAAPFVSPAAGDLHINPQFVFPGEATATPIVGLTDIDGQTRNGSYPDMGADEGDFNGGGVLVTYPNGGDKVSVDYSLDAAFTVNRPLNVRVDLSTDGGTTWTPKGTKAAAKGINTFTFATPNTVTTQARVRVMSLQNQWEGDSSNTNFELVLPVFTITSPNGGERLVPTDTVMVQWTSKFAPPTMKLEIDYSINGGLNWTVIDTNAFSANSPAVNSVAWVVPNAQTQNARIRVKPLRGNVNDISDSGFTILPKPFVKLMPLNIAQYTGYIDTIRWTSGNTMNVRVEYSVNGGASWSNVVPAGIDLSAYLEKYAWTVPSVASPDAMLRIVNAERPRFADTLQGRLSIRQPWVRLTTPNGGEKYELSEPVTVNWESRDINTLRLDYSSDYGVTWSTVSSDVPGPNGGYTFVPKAAPTRGAMVRLVDVLHERVTDLSDRPFEIMPARSIAILAPSGGDLLPRATPTPVTWDAPRVERVDILYSADGGGSWQTVALNVPSSDGSYPWSGAPMPTTHGKIRVQDAANSSLYGESDFFAVVDVVQPTLKLLAPNGGEKYNEGDTVAVSWSSAGLQTVSVYYSSNDGATWKLVRANIPVGETSTKFVAPGVSSRYYRVRVLSLSPEAVAISSLPFEVVAAPKPSLMVLYPNGGETFAADSVVRVLWNAGGYGGNVALDYSIDGGMSWKPMTAGLLPASAGSFSWHVPADTTRRAMVRVSTPDRSAGDVSNGPFTITRKKQRTIRVDEPTAGSVWRSGEEHRIAWRAPAEVSDVRVEFSIDGGVSWSMAAPSVPAATGGYLWMIPGLGATSTTARVRVVDAMMDGEGVSDSLFTIVAAPSGVDDGTIWNSDFVLSGNYPNPFSAYTELRWSQGHGGDIEVRIYRPDGARVAAYPVGHREAGEQRFVVNGAPLSSGPYLYEIWLDDVPLRGVMTVVR